MNIFFLDEDIDKAVRQHNDAHIRKMPIESVQLLSAAIRHHNGSPGYLWQYDQLGRRTSEYPQAYEFVLPEEQFDYEPRVMRYTHPKHPSTLWIGESVSNYRYLIDMTNAMFDEYTQRYKKVHRSSRFMQYLSTHTPQVPDQGLTSMPQAMFNEVKIPEDAILAYRHYYRTYKRHLAQWKTEEPIWWY